MGHERLGRGAAGDVMHHRRLDLEEAPGVEPGAHRADDLGALDEDVARLRRHDQVDIALAVALLDVGHAVELVRQRPQRLGQQAQVFGLDRKLAGAGPGELAFGGHDVAHVQILEHLVGFAQQVLLQPQLQAARLVLDLREARLSHVALEQHAAGNGNTVALAIQRLGRPLLRIGVGILQVAGIVGTTEIIGERDALPAQRREFGATLGDEPVLVRLAAVGVRLRGWGLVGHWRGDDWDGWGINPSFPRRREPSVFVLFGESKVTGFPPSRE